MGFNGRPESSVYHVYVYPDLSGDCGRIVFYNRSLILADLIQFSTQYKGIENTLLKELAVPYAIALEDGRILWKMMRFKINAKFKKENICTG